MNTHFVINEKYSSQIPALQLFINLGYQYLSPEKALEMREGKTINVLLGHILSKQLAKINHITYKDKEYDFSQANIQQAIRTLKNVQYNGLQKSNEAIYDLITLGTTLEETIDENKKWYNLHYIDWKTPSNNIFHVVAEYTVERSNSYETVRPDIVLFVNGIPFCVIECKSSKIDIEQAISQTIRNQADDYIPKLFTYVQLVMVFNKNEAKYATVGTSAKFWSVWDELEDKEDTIQKIINIPLNESQKSELFSGDFAQERQHFENQGERLTTEQDKVIYSLCRPKRLLELTHNFIVFDNGVKKIARYQQFFVVRSILERVKENNLDGKRKGGIVWQTQGSGKSLTMVMLARALFLNPHITNPRIILVTDRTNLDKQLGNTFTSCGLEKQQALSGNDLIRHLKNNVSIITTLIHKFVKGWESGNFIDNSTDVFVLIDESHRTNFGSLAAMMHNILPNACYFGFTGTPLLKKDKNSIDKFGGLIQPSYSIRQAVKDKAVLPLLYEGRHVEIKQNQEEIDLWFERYTPNITAEKKEKLKKRNACYSVLNQTDRVIYMCAFDISEHYKNNWKGSGFKAQIVTPNKQTALRYHKYLKDMGDVETELIISAPDARESHKEVNEGPTDEVHQFWNTMMKRYGDEENYNNQIIDQFKNAESPEILIVVDKLLTGFDAPRNTVLYLCRKLRDHTLLQAIARVNRIYEGKDFGYIIDYANILGELDKAFSMYDAFSEFDEDDLEGTLIPIKDEICNLPQKHSDLWNIFKEVKNTHDQEDFERILADPELREEFYECLAQYNKTLKIALSSEEFLKETDKEELKRYKNDCNRFNELKESVKRRYADDLDDRDTDRKIKKMLDVHIRANDVIQLNKPFDIFNAQHFDAVKKGQGIYSNKSDGSKADTIAHATKKIIQEKMEEDPVFYENFSKLIQQEIDNFRSGRISATEYLNNASHINNDVIAKKRNDMPDIIENNDEACAYYDMIGSYLKNEQIPEIEMNNIIAKTALDIYNIIRLKNKKDFLKDSDAQNIFKGAIDDYFSDEVSQKYNIPLNTDQISKMIQEILKIAQQRKIFQ